MDEEEEEEVGEDLNPLIRSRGFHMTMNLSALMKNAGDAIFGMPMEEEEEEEVPPVGETAGAEIKTKSPRTPQPKGQSVADGKVVDGAKGADMEHVAEDQEAQPTNTESSPKSKREAQEDPTTEMIEKDKELVQGFDKETMNSIRNLEEPHDPESDKKYKLFLEILFGRATRDRKDRQLGNMRRKIIAEYQARKGVIESYGMSAADAVRPVTGIMETYRNSRARKHKQEVETKVIRKAVSRARIDQAEDEEKTEYTYNSRRFRRFGQGEGEVTDSWDESEREPLPEESVEEIPDVENGSENDVSGESGGIDEEEAEYEIDEKGERVRSRPVSNKKRRGAIEDDDEMAVREREIASETISEEQEHSRRKVHTADVKSRRSRRSSSKGETGSDGYSSTEGDEEEDGSPWLTDSKSGQPSRHHSRHGTRQDGDVSGEPKQGDSAAHGEEEEKGAAKGEAEDIDITSLMADTSKKRTRRPSEYGDELPEVEEDEESEETGSETGPEGEGPNDALLAEIKDEQENAKQRYRGEFGVRTPYTSDRTQDNEVSRINKVSFNILDDDLKHEEDEEEVDGLVEVTMVGVPSLDLGRMRVGKMKSTVEIDERARDAIHRQKMNRRSEIRRMKQTAPIVMPHKAEMNSELRHTIEEESTFSRLVFNRGASRQVKSRKEARKVPIPVYRMPMKQEEVVKKGRMHFEDEAQVVSFKGGGRQMGAYTVNFATIRGRRRHDKLARPVQASPAKKMEIVSQKASIDNEAEHVKDSITKLATAVARYASPDDIENLLNKTKFMSGRPVTSQAMTKPSEATLSDELQGLARTYTHERDFDNLMEGLLPLTDKYHSVSPMLITAINMAYRQENHSNSSAERNIPPGIPTQFLNIDWMADAELSYNAVAVQYNARAQDLDAIISPVQRSPTKKHRKAKSRELIGQQPGWDDVIGTYDLNEMMLVTPCVVSEDQVDAFLAQHK